MQRALSFAEARRAVQRMLRSLPAPMSEELALSAALGRVLAEDLFAAADVPAFDNAAMDGYALRAVDLPRDQPKTFALIGTQLAGHRIDAVLGANECVRVTTGSEMPLGADTVVIQENVVRDGEKVTIAVGEKPQANVRPAAGDLRIGERVLRRGTRLTPPQLGLIASLGHAHIPVYQPLNVAHFSTGDELRALGEPLPSGAIYDSNAVTLAALLKADGLCSLALPPVADERQRVRAALLDATTRASVVLTTGGASVGEADFLLDVLNEIGEIHFCKVQMRPGLPFIAARVNASVVFALPGNPVSVMACYRMLLSASLKRLNGALVRPPARQRALLDEPLRKRHQRREFVRAIANRDLAGQWRVRSTGSQSSQLLSSMARGNCLIILPEGDQALARGDEVWIEWL